MHLNNIVDEKLKEVAALEDKVLSDLIATQIETRLQPFVDITKSFSKAEKDFMKNYFSNMLLDSYGNISQVARLAGITRKQATRLLKKLGLDASKYRKALKRPETVRQPLIEDACLDGIRKYGPVMNAKNESIHQYVAQISTDIAKNLPKDYVPYKLAKKEFKKSFVSAILHKTKDKRLAAKELGISLRSLYRLVEEFRLEEQVQTSALA